MSDSTTRQRTLGSATLPSTTANAGNARGTQRWTTALDGLKLRQLRRQRGLSQEKLADRAGISLTTMARLERQHRSPCRTYTLARLAVALGEPIASISFVGPSTS